MAKEALEPRRLLGVVEDPAEAGRLQVQRDEFLDAVGRDPRFVVDAPSLTAVFRHGTSASRARSESAGMGAEPVTRTSPLRTVATG